MANTHSTLTSLFTDIADEIRAKKGTSSQIVADNFPDEIASIPSGGDISEYFYETITGGSDSMGNNNWTKTIKKLPAFELSGTDASYLFYYFKGDSLDLSNIDTSNVTNTSYMFRNCSNIIGLDLSNFNTTNVTDMKQMFNTCSNIIELDLTNFNTSNVTNMFQMFQLCSKLKTLNLSSFNFEKITGENSSSCLYYFINNDSQIENLTFGINLGKGYTASAHNTYGKLDLSRNNKLTHDSLMSVINNLYDISDKNTQDLALGSTNLAKLTAEEIAIATNKGWTVS